MSTVEPVELFGAGRAIWRCMGRSGEGAATQPSWLVVVIVDTREVECVGQRRGWA